MTSYDALLFISFGGPESREDVIPFLENVLRGRNVPRERMLEVAEHYYHFGGISPINQQNRDLIAALESELHEHQIELPIFWGNRNWNPLIPETLRRMNQKGCRRILTFMTSAFSSYSGCRQYRENISNACEEVQVEFETIDKIRTFFNHPGFIQPFAQNVQHELLGFDNPKSVPILFTAHSIPLTMSNSSQYQTQLKEACRLTAAELGHDHWELVYQSRSGPPTQPWLEPDVCDRIRQMKMETGINQVVIAPIGFISDHLEVLFDLDEEAKEVCQELGILMKRAKTVGVHPRFVSMIRELIVERMTDSPERLFLGDMGPSHDVCPTDCCPAMPARRPRS